MAGHSKWSKIKRQKAVTDKARGKLFAKLGREIAVAAREGGGDLNFNPRLRTAVDNARSQSMPNENIERAIKRGTGDLPGVSFEEVTYEGYGPGGVAIFLECLTDNPKRTVAEIRHLFSEKSGNLGQNGSVQWMFERKGQIYVDSEKSDEDMTLEFALEAGVESFDSEEGMYVMSTTAGEFHAVVESLREAGIPITAAELGMVPTTMIEVKGRDGEKVIDILNALDEHEDVLKVYSNVDLEEADWTEMESN